MIAIGSAMMAIDRRTRREVAVERSGIDDVVGRPGRSGEIRDRPAHAGHPAGRRPGRFDRSLLARIEHAVLIAAALVVIDGQGGWSRGAGTGHASAAAAAAAAAAACAAAATSTASAGPATAHAPTAST